MASLSTTFLHPIKLRKDSHTPVKPNLPLIQPLKCWQQSSQPQLTLTTVRMVLPCLPATEMSPLKPISRPLLARASLARAILTMTMMTTRLS